MALIVIGGGPQATQHSTTATYSLAKLHWSAPKPKSSLSVTDGSGALIATLTDTSNDILFNPPRTVTGLKVQGAGSGFLHVYTQDKSSAGG